MDWKNLWENSRSTIISGIIAIVVIAGLFILFNALPAGQPAPNADQGQEQTQQDQSDQAKNGNQTTGGNKEEKVLTTKYTVKSGDDLWAISERFYGTGYNWVLISRTNKLANPDAIHAGNVLTIPKASAVAQVGTHTVVKGDSLWSISERYYGSGFEWTKIKNANPGKIGTLPNGRPLITPGQVLAIP